MKIRSVDMYQENNDVLPDVHCSVCDNLFTPLDVMDFVCCSCKAGLVGHCDCGSDDVVMDWGVELDNEKPYYWRIDCVCGSELMSPPHSLPDQGVEAKKLYKAWTDGKMEER